METIRLMLVDDHEVVRTGLKTFLETQGDMQVIAEADNGEEAIRLAQELAPQVIVMDISMSGLDGLEATRQIKALCPDCKVLALTVHADEQYFFQMLAAGAEGYVTKQVAADELVEAIHAVAAGHVYLQPALASYLLRDYRRLLAQDVGRRLTESDNAHTSRLKGLSRREVQVLECVAKGMTSVQIGEALRISPKTVARHRERIMSKLNMHSSAELVRFAVRAGLVDND